MDLNLIGSSNYFHEDEEIKLKINKNEKFAVCLMKSMPNLTARIFDVNKKDLGYVDLPARKEYASGEDMFLVLNSLNQLIFLNRERVPSIPPGTYYIRVECRGNALLNAVDASSEFEKIEVRERTGYFSRSKALEAVLKSVDNLKYFKSKNLNWVLKDLGENWQIKIEENELRTIPRKHKAALIFEVNKVSGTVSDAHREE